MRSKILFSAILLSAACIFAAQLNLTGTVETENGELVEDAVVLLKLNDSLLAYARTLSKQDGSFELLPGKDAPGEIPTTAIKPVALIRSKFVSYQALDLKGKMHNSLNSLPQGIYVLLGKTENGKNIALGTIYHKGGAILNSQFSILNSTKPLTKTTTSAGDEVQLIVRKAGYLPTEVEISSFNEKVGTVVLKRDTFEDRIDAILDNMDLDDKIYQMTQPQVGSFGSGGHLYGSVLHGGNGYSANVLTDMNISLSSYDHKIPVTYGKDMMHGAAAIENATVFPHNIGMGATRDSNLVRRACEVTAQESWAGNVDLIFGPAISVPQDERWGRVYEGFGETAELAVMMGAACIRGYQGEKYNAPWRVIATAKHYLGDGATVGGTDRGNVTISDDSLRVLHLPGYEAAVEQGVLSVMASFNQIMTVHQHIDSLRLTGWLKTELGFDGYVIADWSGISNSMQPGYTDACDYNPSCAPTASKEAVRKAVNAGIDMAMNEGNFITHLQTLVNEGSVKEERINDAVRRILRAKFRAGRMDNPAGIRNTVISNYGAIGSETHREIAREAVRKSLVLLKNEDNILPISKDTKVFVTGRHANNHGYQCGGWTSVYSVSATTRDGWQGNSGSMTGATSIQEGIDKVAQGARVTTASAADVIIYVTGESPYAEWKGDSTNITFTDNTLATLVSQNPGKKIVTIFISGRPRETNSLLNASDAFVAAWLPGSEGAGIADVLFGDYVFDGKSNKLPHTWPRNKNVFPINSTEISNDWFPYGFGLQY